MFPFHATPPTAIPRLRQTGSEFLRLGRTVYFDACSSLFAYCTERLGYSEDSATKRVRVARLAQQFPQVLPRVEPLSPASVRVEFSAHAAFRDKLEQARALLSHKVPSGDPATILERALDLLIERETWVFG